MLSSSKDLKNIPISISILYDQEFNNLCFLRKILNKYTKRRAFSETKTNKNTIITGTKSPQITKSKPLYDDLPDISLNN
jgi:hypothetical protein